ncbi:MAG: phosphopantothenoylcysteine decarboxylase [Candidatus Firestonebacteria bacterium]
MKIIVTSGPTRSYIDEIRYISNYSTGELGSLIAGKAALKGHKVTQIYGKGSVFSAEKGVKKIEIETVDELLLELKNGLRNGAEAVIHAMAVLDYVAPGKIRAKVKSDRENWTVKFVRSPKVINEIKKIAPKARLVGFKMEYKAGKNGLLKAAKELISKSGAEYIVANDFKSVKAGKHTAMIIGKSGFIKGNIKGKEKIAGEIVELLKR